MTEVFERFAAAATEGWRVELIEERIRVSPPDDGDHAEAVSEITGQIADRRRVHKLWCYTGIGLLLPGGRITGRVEPDIALAPRGSFATAAIYHDPSPVFLVAEVTSADTADSDRGGKVRGYARAGVPVYLLVDRDAEQVVVCTGPAGEDYGVKTAYKLGEVVPLPEPLGFELDTGEIALVRD